MCLAIPSRVIRIEGDFAVVEAAGRHRTVSLVLLDAPVEVGDYVLVMNDSFAYERLDAERARDALALIDQIVAAAETSDVRAWS